MDLEEVAKFKESNKIELPLVFYIVLILLAASIGLIIFGLVIQKKELETVSEKAEASVGTKEASDQDIGKYFEDISFEDSSLDQDQFLKDDPFREKCAATAGDGLPSVSSNTVCLR